MKNLISTIELVSIIFVFIALIFNQLSLICITIFSLLQIVCIILFMYSYWQKPNKAYIKILISVLATVFVIGFVSTIAHLILLQ